MSGENKQQSPEQVGNEACSENELKVVSRFYLVRYIQVNRNLIHNDKPCLILISLAKLDAAENLKHLDFLLNLDNILVRSYLDKPGIFSHRVKNFANSR